MPGIKRSIPDDSTESHENIHPSRRQRVGDHENRADLIKIFNALRDEIPKVRLEATKSLLKSLSIESPDQSQRLDYAITRLIKGVCSGAKAARPGFSIALAEVLRLSFDEKANQTLTVPALIEKTLVLTNPESKAKGEEARNYLLGRQFALQAILRSQILSKRPESDGKAVFDAIADLAAGKQWLRTECGAGLCAWLSSEAVGPNHKDCTRIMLQSWADKGLVKSPEGIAIWLTCKSTLPDIKFPKGHWHHNNPLSAQERPALTKILLKNFVDDDDATRGASKGSGARQSTPNFAWSIVLSFYYKQGETKGFSYFWSDCVAKPMFASTSSTERKALGLQLFTKALTSAPADFLPHVVHHNIIQCIVDQRAKPDRFLYEAAKVPLNQIMTRAKSDASAAMSIAKALLEVLPGNLDKLTKTTLETLLGAVEPSALNELVQQCIDLCWKPMRAEPNEAEKLRRTLSDALLCVIRTRRADPSLLFNDPEGKPRASNLADWVRVFLEGLAELAFCRQEEAGSPDISTNLRQVFQDRLMSALGQTVNLELTYAVWPARAIVEKLHNSKELLTVNLSKQSSKMLKDARKLQKEALEKAKSTDASCPTMYAFHLLLSLGMLQIYRQEPDGNDVLEDIMTCFKTSEESGSSTTMLVELLLSFVSKQSALFRKLAEQVFTAFAPDMTGEALDSMIDILGQKESMAGQQELFDYHADSPDGSGDADSSGSNDSAVDLEDASDVEIIDGSINGDNGSSSEASDDEDVAGSDSGDEEEEEEEAAFDRKLADALGTQGMEQDSDDDGSDMDDDQMMELDSHLSTIFKERKKDANKKQENKDAKDNIINFKNRVLDLLEIYVKSQFSNPAALDLIVPLVELSRTTTSPTTAKKALSVLETFFDSSKKNKALPIPPSGDVCFELIEAILADARLGGSKVHATACSRSSQFLAKILISRDAVHWVKIAGMYTTLQDEWRRDQKSKIHGSILNDWHNFSMQR